MRVCSREIDGKGDAMAVLFNIDGPCAVCLGLDKEVHQGSVENLAI